MALTLTILSLRRYLYSRHGTITRDLLMSSFSCIENDHNLLYSYHCFNHLLSSISYYYPDLCSLHLMERCNCPLKTSRKQEEAIPMGRPAASWLQRYLNPMGGKLLPFIRVRSRSLSLAESFMGDRTGVTE